MGERWTGPTARLVLASSSPRRRALFSSLGLEFDVEVPDVSEEMWMLADDDPGLMVTALAGRKAREVAGRVSEGLVIGADTVVVLDGQVLGKPEDEGDARLMLQSLSGRTHAVVTGVCVHDVQSGAGAEEACETAVRMTSFGEKTIEAYLATGEHWGKAGSYAIQGRGALLTAGIDGSHSNVVGFPVEILEPLFDRLGYSIWNFVL